MKMNLLFLLLPIFCSCFQSEEPPPVFNLTPTEAQIVGQWQEIGPKVVLVDTLGNFVDSVDVNARFTFNGDFTFANDAMEALGPDGTWVFNTVDSAIYFNPTTVGANQTEHVWYFITFDSNTLVVNHFFENYLPQQGSSTVSFVRKFVRM